ncbi:MAG: hypothetical protein GY789_10920, partial [Hyphomicrobiales bacterium]|nr:hypothetical protein [Hyphomicrobiales bacterium]
LRNRDYDPSTGTFLSKDPLGVGAEPEGRPTSANLFAYVGNDPLNYQDPLGLCRMLDGDFYFEQNQDLCQSLADQFGTAACKLEGPGDLVAPYWDPVWDVNDTAGGGCEVPGFEHTVQTCEGIFGGWQWACDQEWAGYVFIDTEVCVWGCVGLTVGDGEVIFQGGCCGFQTPGFGAGV